MPIQSFNRRHFLRGTGGAVLALPTLASLLPRAAHAAAFTKQKRFIAFLSDHGNLRNNYLTPDHLLTNEVTLDGTHKLRYGQLTSDGEYSQILGGLGSNGLYKKMCFFKGIDWPAPPGHTWSSCLLGDYVVSDTTDLGGGHDGTIDQIIAKSVGFGGSPTQPQLVMRAGTYSVSYDVVNGTAQRLPAHGTPRAMFNAFLAGFGTETTPTEPAPVNTSRTPIVDRVLEEYRSLLHGTSREARRISQQDRERLQTHVELISQLDRRLSNLNTTRGGGEVSSFDCKPPTNSSDAAYGGNVQSKIEWHTAYNEVLAAALACNASRIAVVKAAINDPLSNLGGGFHDLVHTSLTGNDSATATVAVEAETYFKTVVQPFVRTIDQLVDVDGDSLLDSSLTMWGSEFGTQTHWANSMPIITFGGCGGSFNTGYYYDFRDLTGTSLSALTKLDRVGDRYISGLLHNQFLATLMRAFGVVDDEFELGRANTRYDRLVCGIDYKHVKEVGVIQRYYTPISDFARRIVREELPLFSRRSPLQP